MEKLHLKQKAKFFCSKILKQKVFDRGQALETNVKLVSKPCFSACSYVINVFLLNVDASVYVGTFFEIDWRLIYICVHDANN